MEPPEVGVGVLITKSSLVDFNEIAQNSSMTRYTMPTREEIHAAYEQGAEAIVALLERMVGQLPERVQALEEQRAQNSRNKPRSLGKGGGKKSGGQLRHQRHTLKAVETPKHLEIHRIKHCARCQASLEGIALQYGMRLKAQAVYFKHPHIPLERILNDLYGYLLQGDHGRMPASRSAGRRDQRAVKAHLIN